jgi:DNA-binding transcriptional MerR regulator
MTAAAPERSYRIGEVATLVGTTTRTIRYYEEIGLLAVLPGHQKGRQRTYGEEDVARLRELLRLRDLLGVSLEELRSLVEAEEARAALRERWQRSADDADRQAILTQALAHVDAQLALVRARRAALEGLEGELVDKRRRLGSRLRSLERDRS